MTLVVVPFVAVFNRFERPKGDIAAPRPTRSVTAVALVCVGLGALAYFGIGDGSGLNWEFLALPFAAAWIGRLVEWRRSRDGVDRRSEPLSR